LCRQDLISKLLVLDAGKRLTAVEALDHPWVRGNAARGGHMEDAQSKLKQFNARRKLKVCSSSHIRIQLGGLAERYSSLGGPNAYLCNPLPKMCKSVKSSTHVQMSRFSL